MINEQKNIDILQVDIRKCFELVFILAFFNVNIMYKS